MAATRCASQELIERYQDLVRSIAMSVRRKVPPNIELDDLVAYGQVGLAEAAKDFDPQRGNAFSTYAYYRIRGSIYDGVSKLSWTSRSRYNRLRQEQAAADANPPQQDTQPTPSHAQRSHEGTHSHDVGANAFAVVSLAASGSGDTDLASKILADPAAPQPCDAAAMQEAVQKVRSLVGQLPQREALLVRAVYFDGKSLQDAGQELGISKSWASRLHAKALKQLAQSLKLQGVE